MKEIKCGGVLKQRIVPAKASLSCPNLAEAFSVPASKKGGIKMQTAV